MLFSINDFSDCKYTNTKFLTLELDFFVCVFPASCSCSIPLPSRGMMRLMIEGIRFRFGLRFRDQGSQVHPQLLAHSQGWLLQVLDEWNRWRRAWEGPACTSVLVSPSYCHLFPTFSKQALFINLRIMANITYWLMHKSPVSDDKFKFYSITKQSLLRREFWFEVCIPPILQFWVKSQLHWQLNWFSWFDECSATMVDNCDSEDSKRNNPVSGTYQPRSCEWISSRPGYHGAHLTSMADSSICSHSSSNAVILK